MPDAPGYAVLLKAQEHWKPMEVARVLAGFRGAPIQDVAASAKASWGIVAENLEESAAGKLASLLEGAGLGAAAIPANLLEDLPPAVAISRAELAHDGLAYSSGAASGRVSWADIDLVAAAAFRQAIRGPLAQPQGPGLVRRAVGLGILMTTGLPIPMGPKKEAAQKTLESFEVVFFLDLISRKAPLRLRVDGQNFDYSCLKARMGYGTLANFKLLVEDVSGKAAAGATRNRGARILLESGPLREMGYDSLADLERESRWLLTVRALGLR